MTQMTINESGGRARAEILPFSVGLVTGAQSADTSDLVSYAEYGEPAFRA